MCPDLLQYSQKSLDLLELASLVLVLDVQFVLKVLVPEALAATEADSTSIWLCGLISLCFSSCTRSANACPIEGRGVIMRMLPLIIV